MKDNYYEEERYLRAQKRVKEIKGFYWHLFWYVVVNLFISISKIMSNMANGETFKEAFFDFGTFAVWIFWGIGIGFHFIGIFYKNITFSKKWEDRKIKEFMDQDKYDH